MPVDDIEIPKHYRTTYNDNVEHLLNNEGSILREFVSFQAIEGEEAAVADQFGVRRGRRDTERHGDTPIMNTPRDRRWIVPETFDWGDLIERKDKMKSVMDPTSAIVTGAAWGLGENIDYDLILPAMFGAAAIGKKVTSGVENFDTNLIVDVQTGTNPLANTGMNKKKIQTGVKLMRQRKVKLKREKPVVAIGAQQWDELMDEVQLTSRDFVNGQVIETGELPDIIGARVVQIEDLEVDPVTGFRLCPLWVPSGVVLGMDEDIFTNMALDPGKKFNMRIYAAFTGGATRTQQGKVVQIPCLES